VRAAGWISGGLLAAALAAGTVTDTPVARPPVMAGGYRVLQADFHIHAFPLSWATLAPWDIVLEARRQGLDAIAITGHNHVGAGQAGRWFSRMVGGPRVLVGEEIHPPFGHLLALGIERTIDWRLAKEAAIDEIHRQGGVAVAAHPIASQWGAWSEAAVRKLDAVEVVHPIGDLHPELAEEMRAFYERAHASAVGDSDYHGLGPLGLCRTFVFARDDSEAAILEAIRAGRTVVRSGDGRVYGNRDLVPPAPAVEPPGAPARVSRACGIAGLLVGLLFGGGGSGRQKRFSRVD
jgi:PHP domain-containing protein